MAQVMYLDETPVVTISALLGLCDSSRRYYKFGTNLWAAFRELRKNDNDMNTVGNYVGMEFPKNRPPKELVETIQKYLITKKLSDESIRQMLIRTVPHHAYLSKYSLTNIEQLRREFERFKEGLVRAINKRSKENGGIRMVATRPQKTKKTSGKKSNSKISGGGPMPPAGNARGYAYGGPVV